MVPARAGRIPIRRAPVRLRAVARSALPISVKSNNRYSRPLNTSAAARIITVCPETCTPAISIAIDVNGSVLTPSGPKNSKPSPTSAKRSEEHTSELQSLRHLVCRLLLEKKKEGRVKKAPEGDNDPQA